MCKTPKIASKKWRHFFLAMYLSSALTRHRLGYFRTHNCLGGGSDPPPPCYLENQWYRALRGGVRKLFTGSSQCILKILWLTLIKSRVNVRSKVKFWRFCMTKPRAGNIDSFCLKLSQSNLKGLVKIPCEHKCHTKYGSGSRSGHERSPESKILFRTCGIWFIVTSAHRIQKSKPFCNLTPCKSTTEEDQVNPGSHKVKFSIS